VTYREFVEYVKTQSTEAVEDMIFDPSTHFFMFNGEGVDGAIVMVQNAAFTNEGARRVVWNNSIVPLIHERKFQRLALVVMALTITGEGEEWDEKMSLAVTAADAERMEGWIATIDSDGDSAEVGEWTMSLDPEIPDWEVLEAALR
jgi:hypothetical protein